MRNEVVDYLLGVFTGAIMLFLVGYFLLGESFSVAVIISVATFLILSASLIFRYRN
ncbi:hypothetical protein HCJ66_05755 [Listeria sp. FSL L7-1582]|uniref:hypothetical protein n=1 Tax=Listeria portnoyi TaxID=2713504 RepID=UPI00164E7689|nr:hypothetical protein [Listeria portnoyi]MBC6309054.1 hypothetical protein [Listeria portnoyi]